MATVPASVDSAFMEERISGGLPLPSQGRLRCLHNKPLKPACQLVSRSSLCRGTAVSCAVVKPLGRMNRVS